MNIPNEKNWKIEEQENGEFHTFEFIDEECLEDESIFEFVLDGCFDSRGKAVKHIDLKYDRPHFVDEDSNQDDLAVITPTEGCY